MRVLVLGGTGSIGSAVVRELIARTCGVWLGAVTGWGGETQPLRRSSGAKAQRGFGWQPRHLDPEAEIARLP